MSTLALPTDDDLQRRVVNYLCQKHHPTLRAVEVSADSGTVVLQGKLNSFYEKQLCLHTAQRVAGVVRIVDQLVVARQHSSSRRPDSSAAAM